MLAEGTAVVDLPLYDTYSNPGVLVTDEIDPIPILTTTLYLCNGALSEETIAQETGCGQLLDGSNIEPERDCVAQSTSLNTDALNVYVEVYRAVDASGNTAVPVLRCIQVIDTCRVKTYESPSDGLQYEFTCAPPAVCSEFGICLSTDEAAAATEEYVVIRDTTPPIISPLPEGTQFELIDGVKVVRVKVLQNDPFTDPGVTAYDPVDLPDVPGDADLTDAVTIAGRSLVDTSVATMPDQPYPILYTVLDSAGNAAIPLVRAIEVINPCAPVNRCPDGSCSPVCISTSQDEDDPRRAEPPVITLVGPPAVSIAQYEVYTRYGRAVLVSVPSFVSVPPSKASVGHVCDRGATATDSLEGVLTSRVQACGRNFIQDGIDACNLNSSVPGSCRRPDASFGSASVPYPLLCDHPRDYEVVFSITNERGLSASISRLLTVTAACDEGERLCDNSVDCSGMLPYRAQSKHAGGSPAGWPTALLPVSRSTVEGFCAGDVNSEGPSAEVVIPPPKITLATHPELGDPVELKFDTNYEACSESQARPPFSVVRCPGRLCLQTLRANSMYGEERCHDVYLCCDPCPGANEGSALRDWSDCC
eukprot:scaffold2984_cov452-Prasinococcus_capsulatus_cf.AAC.1